MPARRPVHQSAEETNDTRRTILEVSRSLFQEIGYKSVSTRQIAEACGLTQPALYHHFANKQEIYLAVHRETLSNLGRGLERIAKRSDVIEARLSEVVRYMLANSREDMSQMFHDLDYELDLDVSQEVHQLFFRHMVMPIASIFAEESQISDASNHWKVDSVMATYLLLGMIRDSRSADLASSNGAQIKLTHTGRAEILVDILLHGLISKHAR